MRGTSRRSGTVSRRAGSGSTAGFFRGARVLVTGGTGTVGLAIVQRVLDAGAEVVRIYSRDESKQFETAHLLERWGSERNILDPRSAKRDGQKRLRFLIGDVRDRDRLTRALDGIDYVFHTAALKHVPSCEYNPFEAVKTNVFGVQNLVEAALARGVKAVVNLSTDKAASPSNTMGASKLMGEKIIIAGNYLQSSGRTVFSSVRFGNVLGSRGSVLPLFREQIAAGGPVTLTDPEMTRFVMSIAEAAELCCDALRRAAGGEVFVRKMPSVELGVLVEGLIAEYAPAVGRSPKSIKVQVIGRRAGETTHEEVMTDEEAPRTLETDRYYIIKPTFMFRDLDYAKAHRGSRPCGLKAYTSGAQKLMTLGEIRAFIREAGLTSAPGAKG
jgi:UDP-N-acetylglucosamine 4,6-dehydratase